MASISYMKCHYLLFYKLSIKPKHFKSFTDLTGQEFDNIYKKEIAKRYHIHEIKCLSERKENRKSLVQLDISRWMLKTDF